MKRVKRFMAWIVAGALGCAVVAASAAAGGPAANAALPVAHSADLAVDGSVAADVLTLRVTRNSGQQPLHVTELAVRLDGHPLALVARADGTWAAPLKDVASRSPGKLEIIVAHDGTLEALAGQLPEGAAAPPASGGSLSALIHKQASWWILNVIIVLVGVIAVSRRMS